MANGRTPSEVLRREREDALVAALEAELERLAMREQEALLDLGHARLEGLPGITSRRELAQIREDMEAGIAALRVLESRQPALAVTDELHVVALLEERLREATR